MWCLFPNIIDVIRPRAEVPREWGVPPGVTLGVSALRVSSPPPLVFGGADIPPPIMIPFVTIPLMGVEESDGLCFHWPGEVEIGGGAGGVSKAISWAKFFSNTVHV